MSGVDERVETIRQFLVWHHSQFDGCLAPHSACSCTALPALDSLAAAVADLEQRAAQAETRPIETLDESALRTIQAQAARVAALETVVAGLEQRADAADSRVEQLYDELNLSEMRTARAEQRADEAEARLRKIRDQPHDSFDTAFRYEQWVRSEVNAVLAPAMTGRVTIPLSGGEMHVTLDNADERTVDALRSVGEAALGRMAAAASPETNRHGLPDCYPYTEPGFNESQAESARWVTFEGATPETVAWHLQPGTLLELWPGGDIFNEHGTLCGSFKGATKSAAAAVVSAEPTEETT